MKSNLLAVTLLLFTQVLAQGNLGVSGTLGVAVSVSSGTTTINYGLLTALVVTTNSAASVTLSSYTNASTTVPPGFQILKFDTSASAQIGFTFDVSPSSAFVSASLQTPSITATSALQIVAGTSIAGILYVSSSASAYSSVSAPGYKLASTSFNFPLPGIGTYVFVSQNINVPIPSYYGEARVFASSVVTAINYTGQFILTANPSAEINITVTSSTTAPSSAAAPSGYSAINIYFNIEESSSTTFNSASLNYFYSDAQIAEVDESSLVFCYLNANGQWQVDGTATVNSDNNTLSQSVTHFSQWGVYGKSNSNVGSMMAPTITLLVVSLALLIL